MSATPPRLYLVDLDRTLFDTTAFGRDLLTGLVTQFHLDPTEFHHQMPQYTLPHEVGYNFFAHAHAVTGQDPASLTGLLAPHFTRTDYTYPDVAAWTGRHEPGEVVIITVGTPAYQGLKLRYAPALAPFRSVVVGDNKGRLIHQALTGHPGALPLDLSSFDHLTIIDDNPATFDHLDHHSHLTSIYLSRPGEKYAGQAVPPHVRTITTFGDLP